MDKLGLLLDGDVPRSTALKKYKSQQSSSVNTPSQHRIQVPKALLRKRDLSPTWNLLSFIKFRKGFAKFMIPIALFKKFLI